MADLITINRGSQQVEPGLAKSWTTSADGRTFTLKLRKGIRFSDGHPFDADDVIFSFTVYLDEAVNSPQRDLLIIDGKPLAVTKLDQYTVRFALPRPYAAAETDVVKRLSAENFALLTRERTRTGSQLVDLGPSLDYNFLVFNLNDLSAKKLDTISAKQAWFRDLKFRQAVSGAVDRDSIVRLVYRSKGTALWGNVGPGNKLWVNQAIPHPQRSLETSRQLLKSAGFSWNNAGQLLDSSGKAVEFSIVSSSSNTQRMKMATLVQDDLAHLGIQVHVVPLDFRAMLDRVFQSFDYEATIIGLDGGEPHPTPEMNARLSSRRT